MLTHRYRSAPANWFDGIPRGAQLLIAAAVSMLIGWSDYITGSELALSAFYLGPIALVSWFSGRQAGFVLAVLSAVMWGGAEFYGGKVYSTPAIGYWNVVVRGIMFLIVNHLVGAVRKELFTITELSQKDGLTGAVNRRFFTELAEVELARTVRHKRWVSLAYIDLDNFKTVNDTMGHELGDQLLKTVVDTLRENLRKPDIVCRVGGDEFLVLMPETDLEQSKIVIERLLERCRASFQEKKYPVSLSIGVVCCQGDVALQDMLKQADTQMYRSKTGGKDLAHYAVATVSSNLV